MTRILLNLLLISIVASGLGCTPVANNVKSTCSTRITDPLNVATFNIRVGYGLERWGENPYNLRTGPEKLQPILAAIRSLDPDIIGLQEVLSNGQARRIARALNYNHAMVSHPNQRPWWGVAILSKCPIAKAETFQISAGKGNAKNIIVATIGLLDGQVVASSIHKDKDLNSGSSFDRIRRAVASREAPVILLGDFNVTPGDRRFELLGGDFIDSAAVTETTRAKEARRVGTWSGGLGYRIDYVLVREADFEVLDAGIAAPEHRSASDHYAYFARIRRK